MPIKIPNSLPAAQVLTSEQVFVMTEDRALHQDIRPLELLFLNLMPKKITTEIQYMRKLSNTALQVNIDLLRVDQHISRNTPQSHLDTFYDNFEDIQDKYYDGMIVTGAPLDQVAFEDVTYWDKLQQMIRWSTEHVTSTLFSCWGVAAALKIFYDLPMMPRQEKLSGIYLHNKAHCTDPLIRGFDDVFYAPQSRYIDFPTRVIESETDLHVLADSPEAGMFLAVSPSGRQVYVTGHPEYDVITLAEEYRRDVNAGKNPKIPCNYFPHDDPNLAPPCTWRGHASLLFGNWLNYYVYQVTPFNFEHRVPERELFVR